ncbi:MAG: hypothetical protein EXR11_11425 [Rhodospirillaceae bacterium]|nr:hypothetical protein [Rhodospirillaceae bacterium]
MTPPAVESGFEAAFWFLERAVADGEYLQPQKLQRLLFLAQAYFGVAHNGMKLMPATFVAAEEGPIEPTLFRSFARGKPIIDLSPVEEKPSHVMDSVWRQFGSLSADKLTKLVKRHPPYIDAYNVAPLTEISFDGMVAFYGDQGMVRKKSAEPSPYEGRPRAGFDDAPMAVDKVLRAKVARNHDGKPVSVTRWSPKRVG